MSGYIHGYSGGEFRRLIEQAELLAPFVFGGIDHAATGTLLEVGCAVGAELKLMLARWPHLKLTGVDLSEVHLDRARSYLAGESGAGKVRLVHGDGAKLPFPDGAFDCAVTIWLLEHVKDPLSIIREMKRVVRPGGRIILTEVENSTLAFEPAVPEITDWWDRFNRFQQATGGEPFIGKRLEGFCRQAGFRRVEPEALPIIYSGRDREGRKKWLDYLADLFLSGAESLERAGYAGRDEAGRVRAAFGSLENNSTVSFRYSAQRVTAWND